MKEELIKFVMDRADKEYGDDFPISKIPDWIDEFFNKYQPERSKREDACKHEWGSEEKCDSNNPYYKCNKCDAVL